MTKIYALLPIKQNSERLPNKNFNLFNKKPLYIWMVNKLLSIDLFDKIIINTDSSIIQNGLKKYNNKIIINKRPYKLRDTHTSMNKIIHHDIDRSEADIYFQTHVTNPLLGKTSIYDALNFFKKQKKYDSIFSVTSKNTMLWNKKSKPINHNPHKLISSQKLEAYYEENSNFYIFSKKSFLKNKSRIGNKPFMYELGKIESLDINDIYEFRVAEQFHKLDLNI
jgi:N-acylneuraminate cytidylyltransferase